MPVRARTNLLQVKLALRVTTAATTEITRQLPNWMTATELITMTATTKLMTTMATTQPVAKGL